MNNVIQMHQNNNVWQKIGTDIRDCSSVSEAFDKSGLNWYVTQKEVYTDVGKVPKILANYKKDTNTFLGFASADRYKVVQNIDAFSFIDHLDNFDFEIAGCTHNYRKVWFTGKYNKSISIDGDNKDVVDTYITFLHGHDGKSGIKLFITPIRLLCTNQLNFILNNRCSFKHSIAHTGDVALKMKFVQKAISNVDIYMDNLQQELDSYLSIKLSDKQIIDNIVKLFKIKNEDSKRVKTRKTNSIDKIISIYKHTDNLQNYKGTAFGFINAVSDFISHREPNRKTDTFYEKEFLNNLEGNKLLERARRMIA